jgi:hypothetical protein
MTKSEIEQKAEDFLNKNHYPILKSELIKFAEDLVEESVKEGKDIISEFLKADSFSDIMKIQCRAYRYIGEVQ